MQTLRVPHIDAQRLRFRRRFAGLCGMSSAKENPVSRIHVFDSHVEIAGRWLNEFIEYLDIPTTEQSRALHALRAALHAIRDRLPAGEVLDLAAQMPLLVRAIFLDGWTLNNDPTTIRDRAAMVARVATELAPDPRLDPVDVLRAAIHLLVEHVSQGEIEDVLATLPKPIASLWHDLTGHALEPELTPSLKGSHLTRRTGFSR